MRGGICRERAFQGPHFLDQSKAQTLVRYAAFFQNFPELKPQKVGYKQNDHSGRGF